DNPVLSVIQIWAVSFTVGWSVEIDVEWFQVSYRVSGDQDWIVSSMLSGTQFLFVFQGLTNDTVYDFKVRMSRQVDQSQAETTVQQVSTCSPGFGGRNCSIGKEKINSGFKYLLLCREVPFNLGIQDARASVLTISWETEIVGNADGTLQYREYGTTEWRVEATITAGTGGVQDIVGLRQDSYWEVRILVVDTGLWTLIGRFHTCEPGRMGANCDYTFGTCTVWGDPHYITFDELKYDFQGDCEYTLVGDCQGDSDSLFELIGDNVKQRPSDSVSYLRELRLIYEDVEYTLLRNFDVRVNGLTITPPYISSKVDIWFSHGVLMLNTNFGLSIQYDGASFVDIQLSYTLFNQTCGLCGTFDRNQDNDFRLRNGKLASDINEFGESWRTGTRECVPEPEPPSPCSEGTPELTQAEALCRILLDDAGPFGSCNDLVDPNPYYESCTYDLCATLPDEDLLCDSLSVYAAACRSAGSPPANWRLDVPQCPFGCPSGTIYDTCGTACPAVCNDLNTPSSCPYPCIETCLCPDGQVLDGDTCVDIASCGCIDENGSYRSAGDSYVTEDCSRLCECTTTGIACAPYDCDVNSECILRNGVRGCFCQDGYRGDGLQCEEAPAVCQVWGDPHYITFDAKTYHFQGACEYALIGDCLDDGYSPPFELSGINRKSLPSDTVTMLEEVILRYGGNVYTLRNGGEVRVNDVARTLPYFNDTNVFIFVSHPNVILETTFGLTIRFDGRHNVEVEVSKDLYLNKTCGLCGTLDGNPDNDFKHPDGDMVTNPTNFGNGWEVGTSVCTPDPGPLDPCSEDSDTFLAAEDLCYILIFIDGNERFAYLEIKGRRRRKR
ncbi:putative zonadhesin, partial [Apostichopus japonicus]